MIPLAPGQTPRAWQLSATAAARAAFRQGMQAVIVSAATGTGKGTEGAAYLASTLTKRCFPELWSLRTSL